VTEEFGKEAAKALVRELDRFDQAGDPAGDVEVTFAWDPALAQVDVGLTNESLRRLQETFRRHELLLKALSGRTNSSLAGLQRCLPGRPERRMYNWIVRGGAVLSSARGSFLWPACIRSLRFL
jgi:hypothetical protein